ncbi:MAG TPA: hypothetical protein VKA38_07675, partial [Draconibacterium sp.]|nr:hypothetical protein [Draconibacterium sp.]
MTTTMNLNRKNFIRTVALTVGAYAIFPRNLLRAKENNAITQLIQVIGNINGEKERAQLLENALKESDFD